MTSTVIWLPSLLKMYVIVSAMMKPRINWPDLNSLPNKVLQVTVACGFFGGALGVGLAANIREAYSFLSNNYVIGDEIFLIGFSREAFTGVADSKEMSLLISAVKAIQGSGGVGKLVRDQQTDFIPLTDKLSVFILFADSSFLF